VLKAQKAVLPRDVPVLVVGGVLPSDIAVWAAAGADGFGLGSGLYSPGIDAGDVAVRAWSYIEACAGLPPASQAS
jgi:2-dehydro-3-deoxyphosphogalactonate aldolase